MPALPALLVRHGAKTLAGRAVVRAAQPTCLLGVPPAVLGGVQQQQRATARQQRGQQQHTHRQQHHHQQQTQQQHSQQRRRPLRRLRLLCAGALSALPAAGARAALLGVGHGLASVTAFSGVSGAAVGLALGLAGKGLRRWHAGRRAAKRGLVARGMAPATEVSILTFNIRGVMDRWPERAPELRKCLKQADADVVCFQEVLTGEFGQEQLLLGSDYKVHECRAALQHLGGSLPGAAVAALIRSLLRVRWTRTLMVSLPERVEGWREQHQLSGGWSRLLRDLAIVPFYGNSIASRLPTAAPAVAELPAGDAAGSSRFLADCWASLFGRSRSEAAAAANEAVDLLVLGDFRAAQRVCLQLRLSSDPQSAPPQQPLAERGGAGAGSSVSSDALEQQSCAQAAEAAVAAAAGVVKVWLINTHLDHAAPDVRAKQGLAICRWMEPLKQGCAGVVLTGDFNAPPSEQLHPILTQHGFVSLHKAAHGEEPSHTWPSGIQAPLMDEGEPTCADYIYAWSAPGYELQVAAAQLCGDRPAEGDATLYPSDHLGLKAVLRVRARSERL